MVQGKGGGLSFDSNIDIKDKAALKAGDEEMWIDGFISRGELDEEARGTLALHYRC